jgi:hypothetical protein
LCRKSGKRFFLIFTVHISFLICKDNTEVLSFFDEIHEYITKLALELSLTQYCISTAMVFFHKYCLIKQDGFKTKLEAKLVASACLFISIKTNYGFISVEKIASVASSLLKGCEEIGEKIIKSEIKILAKIGFDLDIDLPYKFLESMIDYLRRNFKDNFRNFLQTTTNFINDSFKLPLCLNYEPKLIALTSIFLTAKLFNITLPDENGVKWYNLNDKTIKYDTLLEVANLLNNMYMIISAPNFKSEELDIKLIRYRCKGGRKLPII